MRKTLGVVLAVILCIGLTGCLHQAMNMAYVKTDCALIVHPAGLVFAGHGTSALLYNESSSKSLKETGLPTGAKTLWIPNVQNDNNNNLSIGKMSNQLPQAVSSSSNITTGSIQAGSSTTPVAAGTTPTSTTTVTTKPSGT